MIPKKQRSSGGTPQTHAFRIWHSPAVGFADSPNIELVVECTGVPTGGNWRCDGVTVYGLSSIPYRQMNSLLTVLRELLEAKLLLYISGLTAAKVACTRHVKEV